jgi:hypothetical protein
MFHVFFLSIQLYLFQPNFNSRQQKHAKTTKRNTIVKIDNLFNKCNFIFLKCFIKHLPNDDLLRSKHVTIKIIKIMLCERFSLLTNLLCKFYFNLSKTVLRKYVVCLHSTLWI